ncbi:MAG: SPFH domain-containing protein [Microcoleaceae cyanobacterium MO_207.B10]|nr:SPFH domain-containing protein [Microcoleaceae cyanobacterium MO_207.B10]
MKSKIFESEKTEITTVEIAQAPRVSETGQGNTLGGKLSTGLPIALSIFGVVALIWFLNTFLQICKPNEILILSGRKRRTKEGQEVGYRVIFGGRTILIPILETAKTMDLRTMPVPVEVRNAYSKGGTPLHIQAIANVKVSNDPQIVGNAIERFLDRDRSEITRVARETLEGNLRGVVATLTPEQLNEDRLRFAERIADDVSRDLVKLGLQLDTLKIQSVSDDVDYLNSIGRKQIAMIRRDAEIAESNAKAEAEQIEADCKRQSEIAKTQSTTFIVQKENELRKIKAELEQQARSEEERTTAAGKEARARAEQLLQTVRAELERLRLEADQVLPAEAERQARELLARGNAASLSENAQAEALVNDMLSLVWQETGKDAAELFYLQQISMILRESAKIPGQVKLQNIKVIDSGDGKSIASLVNAYPEIFRQFLKNVNQTLGVDVTGDFSTQNGKKVESR